MGRDVRSAQTVANEEEAEDAFVVAVDDASSLIIILVGAGVLSFSLPGIKGTFANNGAGSTPPLRYDDGPCLGDRRATIRHRVVLKMARITSETQNIHPRRVESTRRRGSITKQEN